LIPGFNGGSRIHRDHRSWKRDHVVARAPWNPWSQSANDNAMVRQPGRDSTHQETLVTPKNKAHCHSTSSNTRMGRARDESTRVRGYEVPEGRHPHRTVAWTGTRGLCTRNRPSEAKEERKGCVGLYMVEERTKTQPLDLRRRDSGWRPVTRADLGPKTARKHGIRRND
jgi:hypothetical protein